MRNVDIYIYISIYLSIYLSVYLSIYLSIYLFLSKKMVAMGCFGPNEHFYLDNDSDSQVWKQHPKKETASHWLMDTI